MVLGTLASYINQQGYTASTVADQQYYYYPVGLQSIDTASITIGDVQYPVTMIYDQHTWNTLNALTSQPTTFPRFIFARKSDFGVWPTPQAVYTINFYGFQRDRNLLIDDYTTGSVSVTNGSATVTGSGTTFTTAMVGRWFVIDDATVPGQGYWYKVKTFTSTTVLVLETFFAGTTSSGATYRIGESPELPEEAHILLPAGTASDYYSGMRNDATNALRFDNMFWTGSYNNNKRDLNDENIQAGLIGMLNKYSSRDRDVIIQRQPVIGSPGDKIWSTVIS